jgi:excisionase family DNA binding protein
MEAPNRKPLGVDEAADFLNISTSYLYKLTANGEITHYKPGKRLVFLESDLLAFIEENIRQSTPGIRAKAAKHTMGMK